MPQGLLPRVQDLESELGDLRSRCARLEAECQTLRGQVRQLEDAREASERAQHEFAEEVRAQFTDLARRLAGKAANSGAEVGTTSAVPAAKGGKAKVCFQDGSSTVDIEATSDARPVKKRVPTTFAPAAAQASGLRFADDHDIQEVEADVGIRGEAKLRPTKSRQATSFVPSQVRDMEEGEEEEDGGLDTEGKRVAFTDKSSTVDIEGVSNARSAKQRVPTTFVKGGHRGGDGVSFDDYIDEEEIGIESGSASTGKVTEATLRSTKSRQATSFAPHQVEQDEEEDEEDEEEEEGDCQKKAKRNVKFRSHDSIVEIHGTGQGARSVKMRQSTSFVSADQAAQAGKDSAGGKSSGVKFATTSDCLEFEPAAANGAGAKLRSTKNRQATCFAPAHANKEEEREGAVGRRQVGFRKQDSVVEVEANENARSAKQRSPTAFAPAPRAGGVQFAAADDVYEKEDSEETANLRPIKSRQCTSFVPSSVAPEVEEESEERTKRGVRFVSRESIAGISDAGGSQDDEENIEIEEGANLRPSRVRQATAFTPPPQDEDEDEDEDEKEEEEEEKGGGQSQQKQRGLVFSDDIEELEAACSSSGNVRSPRKRVPTTFVRKKQDSQVSFSSVETGEADDGDGGGLAEEGRRSIRARLPTTFARAKAIDYTESTAGSEDELEDEDEHGDGEKGDLGDAEADTVDAPDIEAHRVPGAEKDLDLIRRTLNSLYFFRDLDQEGFEVLVGVMEVFDFADRENITVQGNTKGTHFFILAEGKLKVLRDNNCCAEITRGSAFGESVVLLSGAQNATVRADGPARVFGIKGHDIRRSLSSQYQKEHKDINRQISQILKAGTCSLLHGLSAYQTQCLFDKAKLSNLVKGEYVMREGDAVNAVHVFIQGELSITAGGNQLLPAKRFGVLGEMGLLSRNADASMLAQEPSQMLTLTREALNSMFGEKLEETLLQSYLLGMLAQHHLFTGLSMEQLVAIVDLSQIVKLPPGGELQQDGTYFMMCMNGSVDAEARFPGGSPGTQTRQLAGSSGDSMGDEYLCDHNAPWSLRVRQPTGPSQGPARVAIWQTSTLGDFLKHRARLEEGAGRPSLKKMGSLKMAMLQDDKEAALRKVVVFRSLSSHHLRLLAESLEVLRLPVGSRVCSQGEAGHDFFIIHTGQLAIKINGQHVRTLGMGDYVGERALLFHEPRSATVDVAEDAELWKINKASFMAVVKGPILDYMKDRIAFQNTKVDLNTLISVRVIGRGGFGVVKMVQSPVTETRYALKCVNKKRAVEEKQQKALAIERSILAELDHPFVIKFVRSFLGKHFVYFLMELVTGGELLDALDKLGLLKKPQAQFYVGALALALEFLHERRIAYLDIKGENCLVDQHGYLKIIDFGIAERLSGGRVYAVKGTPLFMAPEVILGKGYTCSADLWSLGVCMYDFVAGRFPFANDKATNPEILKAVLKAPLRFTKQIERDPDTKSFLQGLLTRDPNKRLGAGPEGFGAIKEHAYFRDFCWDGLLSRQLDPPYIPNCETYAEDQENPAAMQAAPTTNPRMTVTDGSICDDAGITGDDDWVDPDPSWQEHF